MKVSPESQPQQPPSARLFSTDKHTEELSNDQTNRLTINSQHPHFQETLLKFKNYSQRSDFLNYQALKKSPHLKLKKSHGFAYYGEIVDSKRQGMGVMIWDNGRIYEGLWHYDQKQGKGYEEYPSGNKYEGQYEKGKPQGMGRYFWANGEMYEGQWADGLRHGSGTWRGINFDSYVGEWQEGKPHGFGVLVWRNGDRYEGFFKEGLKHGQGYEKYSSGDLYKGKFAMGKKCGFGEYFWKKGGFYKGIFEDGLREGSGVWQSGSGDNYQGEYKRGKKDGYGIYGWANGSIYKGNFRQDLREGYGQMRWGDGGWYKGGWKLGQQTGAGELYSPIEGLKKCRFAHNKVIQVIQSQRGTSGSQKRFNRGSRYKTIPTDGFRQIANNKNSQINKKIKTEGGMRQNWRNSSPHKQTKSHYMQNINTHFKLPARSHHNTLQPKDQSSDRYKSPSRKQHVPHSSVYPNQMHRRIKTTNDIYTLQSQAEEVKLATVTEKPYNLTKLMHRFKFVRSVAKKT